MLFVYILGDYILRLLDNLEKSENWIEVGKIQKIKQIWEVLLQCQGHFVAGRGTLNKFCNLYDQETRLCM